MFYTRIPLGSKYLTLNRHNEGSFTSINKRKYQELLGGVYRKLLWLGSSELWSILIITFGLLRQMKMMKFRCTPNDQTHAASLFRTGSTHVHTAIKSKQRDSLFVTEEKSSINSPDLSFNYAALILFTFFSDLCASKTTMKDISTRRLHSLIQPQNKHFTNNCLNFFPPS